MGFHAFNFPFIEKIQWAQAEFVETVSEKNKVAEKVCGEVGLAEKSKSHRGGSKRATNRNWWRMRK